MNFKTVTCDEMHGNIQSDISSALHSLEDAKDLSETNNPDWNNLYELLSKAYRDLDDAMQGVMERQKRGCDAGECRCEINETG